MDEAFLDSVQQLQKILRYCSSIKDKEFVVGFELQRNLDPLVDLAAKRIVSKCTEILQLHSDSATKMDWHQLQLLNLLPLSQFFVFVEEFRPSQAASFAGKYTEISSAQYYLVTKEYVNSPHSGLSSAASKIKSKPQSLIGEVSDAGDGIFKIGLPLLKRSSAEAVAVDTAQELVPFEAFKHLIGFMRKEEIFFKNFFGPSYQRRKANLPKILTKSALYLKTHLKDFVRNQASSALVSLKMLTLTSVLELEMSAATDLPAPLQWINEMQEIILDEFKRSIRKQCDSLASFGNLKISLTSSELHHHQVCRRFAAFMQQSLTLVQTFHRPWEAVRIELKKLELAFFTWMLKVVAYLRDSDEALVFQINNYRLVLDQCADVAGMDLTASLKFKCDSAIEKFTARAVEHYLGNLQKLLQKHELTLVDACAVNSSIAESVKAIAQRFNQRSFQDFSNISVAESVRAEFKRKISALYQQYYDVHDATFGKTASNENDVPALSPEKINLILENGLLTLK